VARYEYDALLTITIGFIRMCVRASRLSIRSSSFLNWTRQMLLLPAYASISIEVFLYCAVPADDDDRVPHPLCIIGRLAIFNRVYIIIII
jgi:hypothetical protein